MIYKEEEMNKKLSNTYHKDIAIPIWITLMFFCAVIAVTFDLFVAYTYTKTDGNLVDFQHTLYGTDIQEEFLAEFAYELLFAYIALLAIYSWFLYGWFLPKKERED